MYVILEKTHAARSGEPEALSGRYGTKQEAEAAAAGYAARRGVASSRLEVICLDEYELAPRQMTDSELIHYIDSCAEWSPAALEELAGRAGMAELFAAADDNTFELVVSAALEKLQGQKILQ